MILCDFFFSPSVPISASTILGKQDTMWFFNLMTLSPTLVGLTLDQFDMLLGFTSSCQHGRTQLSNTGCSYFIPKKQVFLSLIEFCCLSYRQSKQVSEKGCDNQA